jgi:amidase
VRIAAAGPGILSDETLAVKNVYPLEGFAQGGGIKEFLKEATRQPSHAAAVAKLIGAGADVTGIAQTDRFAYSIAGMNSHYGRRTSWPPDRIPGGRPADRRLPYVAVK